MERTELLIIGAGAAGMAAAISSARTGMHPILVEKLQSTGKKVSATGNGRCNLMNLGTPVYYGDNSFAKRILGDTAVQELTDFWQSIGLKIRYDAGGLGYPCTYLASTVNDCLRREMKRLGVEIRTGFPICSLTSEMDGFHAVTKDLLSLHAKRVILATGGAAQPKLGGNLDAWPWLEALGHRMIPPFPSLTSLRTDSLSVSGLAGLRVKCRIALLTDGKPVHYETGELLFTEHGISGICVMQCSRFALPGRSEVQIDLMHDLFEDTESLSSELLLRRDRLNDDEPQEMLEGLCAPKLAYAVCKQARLPLRGEKCRDLTEAQIHALAATLHSYRMQVTGVDGFDRAQVMAGGVSCAQINPENMESLIVPGLHIVGELLNVDGACGGYNLMFAFLSGIRAGNNQKGTGLKTTV